MTYICVSPHGSDRLGMTNKSLPACTSRERTGLKPIHAAKNIRIPPAYLNGLRSAGYQGGPYLIDLLNAEGWLFEKQAYLEAGAKPYQPVLEVGEG